MKTRNESKKLNFMTILGVGAHLTAGKPIRGTQRQRSLVPRELFPVSESSLELVR